MVGSQALAISRLLRYFIYHSMKMYQICIGIKQINDYSSIKSWYNSASHQMQFPKYMEMLSEYYLLKNKCKISETISELVIVIRK